VDNQEWEVRRERAVHVKEFLGGKVSNHARMKIARRYYYGWLEKPLEELTDAELLGTKFIGPRTVAELRTVVPAP